MPEWKVPVANPVIGASEQEAVVRAVASGRLSRGEMVQEFERRFAAYVGTTYGVAVNSGTSALMVALTGLGVGAGDEVITTCLTCSATVNAICLVGAAAVLVDVDDETLNLRPDLVERAVSSRTKAIVPVHLFGHPADMDPILEVGQQHGLPVLEDAALALGARYKGSMCGALGLAGCFSFYGNKHITTGEGGMVVTDSADLHWRLMSFATLGKATSGKHDHDTIGYNFGMTEMQAGVGSAQLDRANVMLSRRIEIAECLTRSLAGLDKLVTTHATQASWAESSYWAFWVLLRSPPVRLALEEHLHQAGIETRPLLSFIPNQRAFAGRGFRPEDFPTAREVHARGMYITCSPSLDDETVRYVGDVLGSFRFRG